MTLDSISSWLGKLGGAPGYLLVFLFCVGAIKALRTIERFPNDGIWLSALLLGAVLNSLIADPMTDTLTFRVWLMKNALFGGIIGFLAVISYNKVFKKFITFFGGQRGDNHTDMIGRPPEN